LETGEIGVILHFFFRVQRTCIKVEMLTGISETLISQRTRPDRYRLRADEAETTFADVLHSSHNRLLRFDL
jgi:hypothetical protein